MNNTLITRVTCQYCKERYSTYSNKNRHEKNCWSRTQVNPQIMQNTTLNNSNNSNNNNNNNSNNNNTNNNNNNNNNSNNNNNNNSNNSNNNSNNIPTTATTKTYPEEYYDSDKLALWIEIRKQTQSNNDKGDNKIISSRTQNWNNKNSKSKVYTTWPIIKTLIIAKKVNSFDRLPLSEQKLIKEGNVPAKHVGQVLEPY
jgi:hypothetical protein